MYALIYLVFTLPLSLWRGFVLSKLWLWIITPTFNLRPLSIAAAIGLSIFASFLTAEYSREPENDGNKEMVRAIAIGIIAPALTLIAGFIVSFWV